MQKHYTFVVSVITPADHLSQNGNHTLMQLPYRLLLFFLGAVRWQVFTFTTPNKTTLPSI